jgi:hypothetical protein
MAEAVGEEVIDVVAVVVDRQGGVRWALMTYLPDEQLRYPEMQLSSLTAYYYPERKKVPTIRVSEIKVVKYEPDRVKAAQWELPGKYNKAALRFQSDADLARMPDRLKTPPGTVTFMDTSDYEAWLVMLAMAEQ